MNYQQLKHRHRQLRDNQAPELATRIHRSLSWLQRAEREADDVDARFIFLWIAFNAAYAQELPADAQYSETGAFNNFIERLLQSDGGNLLYDILWDEFMDSITRLLENRYTFGPYWKHQKGLIDADSWQHSFEGCRIAARKAFENMNSLTTLGIIFDRLYVLRNQLIHGNATWNSRLNREALHDGSAILGRLVPTMIHLMMEHPDKDWGPICYPVVAD